MKRMTRTASGELRVHAAGIVTPFYSQVVHITRELNLKVGDVLDERITTLTPRMPCSCTGRVGKLVWIKNGQ